ncbi:unnamed protein product [Miscanthus lutarioriparius]|uniref:Uncharacterized protein n=1 Tax=Miscanthus lutarioriparius TaxID=422564 RepID=A0A811N5D1_9POAL|nr:unnamed protein product [Miscanthus lutarioriparius]
MEHLRAVTNVASEYTHLIECHRLNGGRTTMILLLLLASLLASPSASTRPGFDYFVLALQWPGTVCRSSAAGPCCSSNACCRSDPIRWFTIREFLFFSRLPLELQSALHAPFHPSDVSINTFLAIPDGLWPNYAQGDGPTCCNNPDFDMAKVSNLTTELHEYWPSLYCSSPSLCSGGHGSL